MPENLILIDGHYQVYRSFFAFGTRPLTNSEGQRVETAYTIAQMLWRIYSERREGRWAFAMDSSQPTFRHEKFVEYKANRESMPGELRAQLPWVETIVKGFRIPVLKLDGYEADDGIATAATQAAAEGWTVEILSKDKDLEQVLSNLVRLRREARDRDLYGPQELFEKRGIRPDQVIDYQALIGDSTDNIPGVRGIGPKTAIKILAALEADAEHGTSVVRLIDNPPPGIPPSAQKKIDANPELLLVSRELVTLRTDAPLPSSPEEWQMIPPDLESLQPIFLQLGFQKMLKDMTAALGPPAIDLRPEDTLFANLDTPDEPPTKVDAPLGSYHTIVTDAELDEQLLAVVGSGCMSLATEASGEVAVESYPSAVAWSTAEGTAYAVDLSDDASRDARVAALRRVLEHQDVQITGHDLKLQAQLWRSVGVRLARPVNDTMLSAYLLNPTSGAYRLDSLLAERFAHSRPEIGPDSTLEQRTEGLAADADLTGRLGPQLDIEIEKLGLARVRSEIEIPLVPVLVEMERIGIRLDPDRLAEQERELAVECESLEGRIHEAAGGAFNIGSPKQLQEILFERLELEPAKKTKTGYSTSASVLEELVEKYPDQPVPSLILEYRSLSKLLNTYLQALPKLVNPATGRLHTDLRQAVAATGRLSSHRPNLQNIPIRTEVGRRIRRAFVPSTEERRFLSADYSQIELRILAHYCGDSGLRSAMTEGGDIHQEVAARVHDKDSAEVTREERSAAKAVTFGVIYGMGAFGLSRDLGIPRKEAAVFIDRFFAQFPGVREFIDSTIATAYEQCEVRTLFGRRRPLPELASRMQRDRKQGERYAVNTVIQGSAADLIKKAMIDSHAAIQSDASNTTMLLQIHDELLFEVDAPDLERETERVRTVMEGVLELDVPLLVNVSSGKDWYDASK